MALLLKMYNRESDTDRDHFLEFTNKIINNTRVIIIRGEHSTKLNKKIPGWLLDKLYKGGIKRVEVVGKTKGAELYKECFQLQ